MQALRWHGPGDLRLEDVPEPGPPARGEAIVEVAWCGICGTDLHEYTEGPMLIRPTPHPLTGQAPPITLGHEFSGRVVALGQDVVEASVGDRVVVDPCWRCGTCYWCRRGDYHVCRRGGSVGLASDGALARLVRVQGAGLVRIPESVDDRIAALAEPLAVGLHAVRRAHVRPGDRVVVVGAGPIGAAAVLAARAAGATEIIVSEPRLGRRHLAEQVGATRTLDPGTQDIRNEVRSMTEAVGADVVLECTGGGHLVAPSLELVRRGGRLVLLGIGTDSAVIDPRRVTLFERQVVGSLGYRNDIPRVLDLIATGRLDPTPLVTGTVPLPEAVGGAFDALLDPKREHVKVLVDVGGSGRGV